MSDNLKHRSPPGGKKIALINLTRMGDLLMTGPLIEHLRQLHPGCHITLFAVSSHLPVAHGMDVDQVFEVEFNRMASLSIEASKETSSSSLHELFCKVRDLVKPMRALQFDIIINTSFTKTSAILSWLLRGTVAAGMHLDSQGYSRIEGFWAQYFFAGNLNRSLNPYHLADVIRAMGGGFSKRATPGKLHYSIPGTVREEIRQLEKTLNIPVDRTLRIALQCGASTGDKKWEAEKFGMTAAILKEKIGAHFILLGTAEERTLAEEAAAIIGNNAFNLAGSTDIPHLAAWLESCKLLITNDTGTMHLAQAVGTPSIDITLGAALSDETGPYGAGNVIIEPDIECFPCNFQVQCPHTNCHHLVKPELVADIAELLMMKDDPFSTIRQRNYRDVHVWRTDFDEDGWWCKRPLIIHKENRMGVAKAVFREVWKNLFIPEIRPNGADIEGILFALREQYGDLSDSLRSRIREQDIPAARTIIALGKRAEKLAVELVDKAKNIEQNLDRIKEIGIELAAFDHQIDDTTIVQEFWRPLMLLFQFARQNLPPGDLKRQASKTIDIYRNLVSYADTTLTLIEKTLDNFEQDRVSKTIDPHPELQHTGGDKAIRKEESKWQPVDSRQEVFQPVYSGSGTGNSGQLARKRFGNEKDTIIVLQSDYFIQQEMIRAFRQLGNRVFVLKFEDNPRFIQQLLEASIHSDMLFTINHLGFDQQGALASILHDIQLPYVSWYVDRPGFILLDHVAGGSEFAFIYTWERSTIAEIKSYGFENVGFLPLATDDGWFLRGEDRGRGDIRWVANSMVEPSSEWRGKSGIQNSPDPMFQKAVTLQRSGRLDAFAAIEMAAQVERINLDNWTKMKKLKYASAVALTATRELRREIAAASLGNDLVVYGDPGWELLVPGIDYQGALSYPVQLAGVYHGGVHLNATSFQMPTSVNQRVFDIPASGGILVTDDQEDLGELFDLDQECITFTDPEESSEKASYYVHHAEEGLQIMNRARKRIVNQHTYRKRAENILRDVKKMYSSSLISVEGGIQQ